MKEEWLMSGAVVPVDVDTTAALVAEIKRLIDVVGGLVLKQGPDYERGFVDGMQKQMQSSVDRAVNRMARPEQEPVGRFAKFTDGIWREVTDGSPGMPLYTTPPAAPVQKPVAWMTITAYGEEDDIHYECPEGHLPEGWTYKPLYTHPLSVHQEPVSMRMPKVGDMVICLEDESLATVVSLTAGGSPDIVFSDGSRGTYLLREFAELFGYTTPPAAQRKPHYDKTEMNCFVQNLYDQKMREGKRGHYETMFHVVHRAIAAAKGEA